MAYLTKTESVLKEKVVHKYKTISVVSNNKSNKITVLIILLRGKCDYRQGLDW
jgi:hypothetical protein